MLELVKKENNNNWTSKKELMNNLQISSDTIEQIISDLSCRRPADTQIHIKKGGYHNSEVIYDDYLVNMITAELSKHNTNQNTGVIQKQMNTEAKEQGIHNIVDNSGYKYSKEDICSICNVDEKTFRRFFEEVRLDSSVQPKVISERDFISVGSSHKKLYTETVLQKFQLWLKKNAMNAGG